MLRQSLRIATKNAGQLTPPQSMANVTFKSCVSYPSLTRNLPPRNFNGISVVHFSTKDDASEKKEKPDKESLRDTINRIKSEDSTKSGTEDESSSSSNNDAPSDFLLKARDLFDQFKDSVGQTWQDFLDSGKPKGINKKIGGSATSSKKKKEAYTGPVGLVIINEAEHLGAWEKMQRRLAEAPIIAGILGTSQELYEKSGAKDAAARASEKIEDVKHDAQEAWETSQNPWVYRVSSVYDTLTAESDFAAAVRQLRVLDPAFTLESFKHDAVEHTLPMIMKWFLQGKIGELEPWLGEAVYHRLSAEIKTREKEGIILDDNILSIFNTEILEATTDKVNKNEPILLMHFMCQQINCARNAEGEIVEGNEDDIRAHSYLICFQREYDEEEESLNWKIVDFRPNGAIAWI